MQSSSFHPFNNGLQLCHLKKLKILEKQFELGMFMKEQKRCMHLNLEPRVSKDLVLS